MTPKIRLKGFNGEWKTCKLGDVAKVLRGVRVTRQQLTQDGCYPVYQNTNYPLGYFNNYNVESYNPFVILGGSAGLVGFSNCKFWAADDCAFFNESKIIDKYWLYCILQLNKSLIKKNVRGSSVPRLERSALSNLEINVPSLPEQRALATFFTSLDNQISVAEKRLASLKQVKAASLQAMFPQEGETTPKLRFKGCEGEWKKVKLEYIYTLSAAGDLRKELFSLVKDKKHPYPVFSNSLEDAGLYGYTSEYRYEKDALTITGRGTLGHTEYRTECFDAIIRLLILQPKKVICNIFIKEYINHKRPFVYESTGVPQLTIPQIKDVEVPVPSYEEQVKIASYFTTLDRQISAQSSKISKLKQIKSACLDQMFV